ncbi:MAG: site-specific integrase [Roseococcus sp.]
MSFERTIQPMLPALFSEAPAPSFAQLLTMIPTWTDLSEARRRDMASALRVAARIAQRDMANLRCDPAELNEILFQRTAAASGLSTSRYQCVISLIRATLRRIHRHAPTQQGEAMLGARWQGFMGHLPKESALRAGLRGLARWCDASAITPEAVDHDALARFLEFDRQNRISAAIPAQGRNLAQAWKTATGQQPDPNAFQPVNAPPKRAPYTFPLSAYPPSFQDEVQGFMDERRRVERKPRAIEGDAPPSARRFRLPVEGPFTAPRVPGRTRRPKWKPRTIGSRTFSVIQAAAALVHTGTPIEQIKSLRDLVQPLDHVRSALEYFDNGTRLPVGGQISQIGEVLRQIAQCQPDISEEDRAAISEWAKEVRAPRQREMGPKAFACLKALIQPRARAVLLHLPKELLSRAKSDDLTPMERAKLVRTAVAISILTHIPLRIGNLHRLRLTEHLVRLDGGNRPSHLIIEGVDTKNEEPIRCEIPRDTAQIIQHFLEQHRPLLAAEGNVFLFSGVGQDAYSIGALREAFKSVVERETGVAVYPHAMRHFAGWLLLKHQPGAFELVRRLLGHRDVATTRSFYLGLEADAAVQLHDAALLKERKETKPLAEATFRRNRRAYRPRRSRRV